MSIDTDTGDLKQVPVTVLQGVGPRIAGYLKNLGITTAQDVLYHLPNSYQDRTHVCPLGQLIVGQACLIQARIIDVQFRPGKRSTLWCRLADEASEFDCRFFYFRPHQAAKFKVGRWLRCFGEVQPGVPAGVGNLGMMHPDHQLVDDPHHFSAVATHLTAVYPTTKGVSQHLWTRLVSQVLDILASNTIVVNELIPPSVSKALHLPDYISAITTVHRPVPDVDCAALLAGTHPARQRLSLEELTTQQVYLQGVRLRQQQQRAFKLEANPTLQQQFLAALPFGLTAAQQRVTDEIATDLMRDYPMRRLVQGDVGSGKTIVAALAVLQAVSSGYQVAVMAPTELLAEQHLVNFKRWFGPLNIHVEWLSGQLPAAEKRHALERIEQHQAQVVIGTHALFQAKVTFARLALVIIDEQHRFGVLQRQALLSKGQGAEQSNPHQLIMSATPIPRTLAHAVYADLDISMIDELPPGRQPVTTALIAQSRRPQVIERVRLACQQGRQVYWVCPLIEVSEVLRCQAATEAAEQLRQALPECRVGLVHGRVDADIKVALMQQFKQAELDILVATTVIEVGVDVPNASLMIIENAERMGLSQLHQLRGRVGRGSTASYCVLLYQSPLTSSARQRLQLLRDSQDGFVIAEQDLAMRGPGDLTGVRQAGLAEFKLAELPRDAALVDPAISIAQQLVRGQVSSTVN